MTNVLHLADYRRSPYVVASERCGSCGHSWISVAPVEAPTYGSECSSCGNATGVVRYLIDRDGVALYDVADWPNGGTP